MDLIISNNEKELLQAGFLNELDGSDPLSIYINSGEVFIDDQSVVFKNILDLLIKLEKLNVDIDRIFILGVISDFSSEINIRTVISGFLGLSKGQLKYKEETKKLQSRISVLNRCFSAVNLDPIVETFGEYTTLSFGQSSLLWSGFCLRETKKLIYSKMLLQSEFIEVVSNHLKNKKSFSFIRLNHCENRILGYDFSFPKEEVDITYAIQLGEALNSKETGYISARMKEAVKNSTVIGVPKDSNLSSNKLRLLESTTNVHLYGLSLLNNQSFASVNIHYDLGQDVKFKELLQSVDKIVAITCRDITSLERSIGRKIHKIDIPAEHRFKGENKSTILHYPDAFYEIEREIESQIHPGVIVLVGAGILGKIYCDTISKCGGVAIDVGSLMDAIENIPTRGDGFEQFNFWWSISS